MADKQKAEQKTDKPPIMPKPDMPSAIMSEQQKTVFQAVKTAKEPRRFESVEELSPPILMAVPDVFTKNKDRSYRWGNVQNIRDRTAEMMDFQVVNRVNHPDVPDAYFDLATGAVLYMNQNILMYTWKETVDMKNAQIVRDFNMGLKPYEGTQHFEAGTIEKIRDEGDGRTPIDLDPDAEYDFGSAEDLKA